MCFITVKSSKLIPLYVRYFHERHLTFCLCTNLGNGVKFQRETAIVSQMASKGAKLSPLSDHDVLFLLVQQQQ
jgi:hypothetical protein